MIPVLILGTGCKRDTEPKENRIGTLTWTFSDDGTLAINGTGDIPDYRITPTENLPPWFDDRNDITKVIIGDNVSKIGSRAFFNCKNLTSVTIGNSVTNIGDKAFLACSKLQSVTIPNLVTSIGDEAFAGCSSMTSLIIPNSVKEIGMAAFYECSDLTSVIIGNSVTSIGDEAFLGCSSLTSVTIGSSVTSIGNDAFRNCSDMEELINHQTMPQKINGTMFRNSNRVNCTLSVPAGSLTAYRAADVWKEFGIIQAIQ